MSNTGKQKDIAEILKAAATENKIACARIFEIIKDNSFFPDIAGIAMNENKIKITVCQLGLFGHSNGKNIPACEKISEKLEDIIYENLESGKLPCPAAWNIAEKMKMKKMDVAAACEKMGIKINKCQLGAF